MYGELCKNQNLTVAKDLFYLGLDKPRNTSNLIESTVTPINVAQIAGLNTFGISLVYIDYAPYGRNPPHTHS